jgi:predicted GNAT family acetyltransferase
MELRVFDDPGVFSRRAAAFLLVHEAEHNLIFGVCAQLQADPARFPSLPYLATVEREGTLAAVALLTPPHNLVLSRTEWLDGLPLLAEDLRARGIAPPGVIGPRAASRTFAAAWEGATGQRSAPGLAMRIYQLDRVIPVMDVPGELCPATVADRDLLIAWIDAFTHETIAEGDAAAIVDRRLRDPASALFLWCIHGTPVSMAGQSGPTPRGIRINAVYTPPDLRRNGYASACVAALSQHLLDSGYRFCFLLTDLANPTSNRIYQAIGYEPIADVDEYRFLPAGT